MYRHLLLLAAAICLAAAGFLIWTPLGLVVVGLELGAAWFLLAEVRRP